MKRTHFYSALKCGFIVALIAICQACSLNVPIDEPGLSELAYSSQGEEQRIELVFKDGLNKEHKVSHGRITINLKHKGVALETASFVADSLDKELRARGLSVEFSESATNVVELKNFEVLNHRVSGFSPMVTISTLKVDLKTELGTKRIAAMVKRAKVPVWTMGEINEPCFNEPIELLIKELAAKINKELFNRSLDDHEIDTLVTKIREEGDKSRMSYFDVYELGFSNNPRAIVPLKEFTQHGADYVRMAAISSLGILRVEDALDDLVSIYQNSRLWHDRGMALKAIGDIGNERALSFLKQERENWKNLTSKQAKWNTLIIGLYLD